MLQMHNVGIPIIYRNQEISGKNILSEPFEIIRTFVVWRCFELLYVPLLAYTEVFIKFLATE